ncbi:MAG: GIY-YIG nuclease family protein [Flavobacteriales bacterium]|nr:GIY-YIG nuclease family protein [Flavobacteriales bacterium]
MDLEYDYWTGSLNDVKASLKRSVAQYIRNHKKVKIGITNNPERRKNQHAGSDEKWDKMIVKYQTFSINFIDQLEKLLIDEYWDYIQNEIGGGGGPKGDPPYYLYVLLK